MLTILKPNSQKPIRYRNVFCAPGAQGFFGEGYPWHKFAELAGMDWSQTSFVAKTFTSAAEKGNMPLESDGLTPKEFKPKCIEVYPRSGHVLNAVGLSNVGFDELWSRGRWQKLESPFMLSFMPKSDSKDTRVRQAEWMAGTLVARLKNEKFRSPFCLQINFACPNTGKDPKEFLAEVNEILAIFQKVREVDVPIVANFNATVPLLTLSNAKKLCDAFWIANTIPWGTEGIDWNRFGKMDGTGKIVSPLIARGLPAAGGLSGPVCLDFTIRKLIEATNGGIDIPIIAGNGIQSEIDVKRVAEAGASGIAIGAVALVRPWKMKAIVDAAYETFEPKEIAPTFESGQKVSTGDFPSY